MNPTKILEKIFQIVGLAVGILFLIGILVFAVGIGFTFFQYKTHHVEGIAVGPNEDTGKLKVTVEYGLPLPPEGSDYLMVPVKLEKRDPRQERDAYREISSYSYDKMGSGSYSSYAYWGPCYNLVFINKKTGESRPLLAHKGYIDGVYFPEKAYEKRDAVIKCLLIVYHNK